jgi:hypothetical protein
MSDRAAPDAAPTPTPIRRRWIPFWVLQVSELAVAFALVDLSVHVDNSGLMVGAAIAFTVLAVTARGPLGVVRICPPWLHLTLVIAVTALVAVAPIIPALRPDIEGIIVLEFTAVGLLRLATLTDMHSSRARRSAASGRNDGLVIDATATVSSDPTVPAPPAAAPAGGAAARWAGRAAGSASASGRQAVAKHRPEAEKQLRRAIRGAGRFAGKVTSDRPTVEHEAPAPGPPGDPSAGGPVGT